MTTSRVKRGRGTTLLELTVASTLFLGMATVLLALLLQNQRSAQKVSGHNDATAQLMLLFERVRAELRVARIVSVDPGGSRLKYWLARTLNGVPVLSAAGRPDWVPGAPADPDVAEMYVQGEALRRDYQGKTKTLARVGKDGQVKFTWNAPIRTLTLSGQVGQLDGHDTVRNNRASFSYDIYLSNNE